MDGGVTITLDDIYGLLVETRDDVKALKANDRTDDHENRIRALEKLVWKAAGVATGAGALLGVVGDRLFG